MNGLASASSSSLSLLHTPDISAAGATNTLGAGSTAISKEQSSPQDSHSSIDHNPLSTTASIIPQNHFSQDDSGIEDVVVGKQDINVLPKQDTTEPQHSRPITIKEEPENYLEPVNGQIELLEHTPDSVIGPGEAGLILNDDGQDWIPDTDHELKRVKVYELVESRWMDQGTAFCFGQFSEETNEALLIARSERNYDDIILSTAIRSNDVYQRQQTTLIVWTEPDGMDYALSFQDPEGCAEVWNFIIEVQRHMNSSEEQTNVPTSPGLGAETSVTASSIIRLGRLPPPEMGIIIEIERAIKALSRTQLVKERICEYIQQEEYIKALIEVMHQAEDLESLEDLHALCTLMQTILMLNDHSMYEYILEDDIFFGVVGMLEYDPDFPGHKANYREFLNNTAQFHQPISIRDLSIQRKIHHTYRLQFLKDVVLARALDDSTFNVLNSCIIFNQIDIIQHVQQEPTFLREVVRLFVDEDMLTGGGPNGKRVTFQPQQIPPQVQPQPSLSQPSPVIINLNGNGDSISKAGLPSSIDIDQNPSTSSPKLTNGTTVVNNRGGRRSGSYAFAPPDNLSDEDIALRREVIMLLQQLSIMGKNVQMPARIQLFRTLVDRGVLFAVQWALSLPEQDESNRQTISVAGEVLSAILDHDLNGVRGHVLKQELAIEKERQAGKKGAEKAETILEMACRIMAQSKDLALQNQMGDALKAWLDVPSTDTPGPAGNSEAAGPKPPSIINRKDEPGTERFLDSFYKNYINIVLQPLSELPDWRNFNEPMFSLTREATNRCVYLCDLTHNFIQQHHFRSHFHFMSSEILPRIATLFKVKDKHLRHSAFRIFRLLLKQGNANNHAQIMRHDILKPILDLTLQESLRDNLLSCSCQEYFEHIRKENIKDMIKHCMTKHEAEIQQLAKSPLGRQRFELFIRRWEINNAPPEQSADKSTAVVRTWSGPGLDFAEEDYFNADDDDEDLLSSVGLQPWQRAGAISPLPLNNTGLKRKRRPGISSSIKGYRPPLKSPQLTALVDYGDDDEEPDSTGGAQLSQVTDPVFAFMPFSEKTEIPISKPPNRALSPSFSAPSPSPSTGPPPKRKAEDDDDNILENLARTRARSQSPSPNVGPLRPSEKRRRLDDEDDEALVRFSISSKKPDLGRQKETPSIPGRSKTGDDPPAKKIKLKFGAVGLAVASTLTSQSKTSTMTDDRAPPAKKFGDTG